MGCLKLTYYPVLDLVKNEHKKGVTSNKSALNERSAYLYGFNGMEKDDEVKGGGNSYDFGARMYDSRLGRWLSLDPLARKYPNVSPYVFAINNPIFVIDYDGRDILTLSEATYTKFVELITDLYGKDSELYNHFMSRVAVEVKSNYVNNGGDVQIPVKEFKRDNSSQNYSSRGGQQEQKVLLSDMLKKKTKESTLNDAGETVITKTNVYTNKQIAYAKMLDNLIQSNSNLEVLVINDKTADDVEKNIKLGLEKDDHVNAPLGSVLDVKENEKLYKFYADVDVDGVNSALQNMGDYLYQKNNNPEKYQIQLDKTNQYANGILLINGTGTFTLEDFKKAIVGYYTGKNSYIKKENFTDDTNKTTSRVKGEYSSGGSKGKKKKKK